MKFEHVSYVRGLSVFLSVVHYITLAVGFMALVMLISLAGDGVRSIMLESIPESYGTLMTNVSLITAGSLLLTVASAEMERNLNA